MQLKISIFLLPLAVSLLSGAIARSQEANPGQQSPTPSNPALSTPAATSIKPAKPRLKPPFFEEGRGFDVGFSESFLGDAILGVPDPGAGGGTGTDFNPVLRPPGALERPLGIFEQLPR